MTTIINADNGVSSGVAGLKTSADNSGVLALQTNGTTALTVNASQAIGVGSTPSYGTSGQVLTSAGSGASPTWTTVGGGSSQWTTTGSDIYYNTGGIAVGTTAPVAGVPVTLNAATGNNTNIAFQEGTTTKWYIRNINTNGGFSFYNNTTANEVMLLTGSGVKTFSTISVGAATPSTSGAGITFPATQSASSDANTLDDYEEGSWTPNFSPSSGSFSSITWADQTGRYVKVGRMVIAWGSVYTNAISVGTASGDLQISGLPFSVATGTSAERGSGSVANCQLWNTSGNPESVGNVGGGTTIYMYKRTTAGGDQSRVQVSDLNTGVNRNSMNFTFIYPV